MRRSPMGCVPKSWCSGSIGSAMLHRLRVACSVGVMPTRWSFRGTGHLTICATLTCTCSDRRPPSSSPVRGVAAHTATTSGKQSNSPSASSQPLTLRNFPKLFPANESLADDPASDLPTHNDPVAERPADDFPMAHDSDAAEQRDIWSPNFDTADDLGGLLSASSPLLSRAFRGAGPPRESPGSH